MAREGDVVAFVEVKTRSRGVAPAVDALGMAQRSRIRRASEAWIHAHPGVGSEFRFDVVAIDLDPSDEPRIEHIRSAFFGEDAR